jgi:AcrR family transcriptional regulator
MPKPRFAKLEPTLQRHILDVAARELALHGFEGASYNRIIEESGTSKGAMYYYFADKADLYATVLADSISRFQRSIGPLPAIEGPEDFWSAVRHIALQGIHHYRVDPHAIGLARSVAADAARGALPAAMGPLRQVMTAWMLDLMAMGTRGSAVDGSAVAVRGHRLVAVGAGGVDGGDRHRAGRGRLRGPVSAARSAVDRGQVDSCYINCSVGIGIVCLWWAVRSATGVRPKDVTSCVRSNIFRPDPYTVPRRVRPVAVFSWGCL